MVFKQFYVHPYLGKMIPFDDHIFQMVWTLRNTIVDLELSKSPQKNSGQIITLAELTPNRWFSRGIPPKIARIQV